MTVPKEIHCCRPLCLLGTEGTQAPQSPHYIYGDQKGAVACDMKSLELIKQFRQVLVDLAELPPKQQKTMDLTVMTTLVATLQMPVVVALVVFKPSILEVESSKAAEVRSKAPIPPETQILALPQPQAPMPFDVLILNISQYQTLELLQSQMPKINSK